MWSSADAWRKGAMAGRIAAAERRRLRRRSFWLFVVAALLVGCGLLVLFGGTT
jgi:hypothetical protein